MKKFIAGLIGFLILDLYFNLVPPLFGNPFLQFGAILVFFPLAYFIAKWAGLDGLKGMGMVFHDGWKKNFSISFMIGFGFWMLMFGLQFLSEDLEFVGFTKTADLMMPLLVVLVGYFVGSLINDLIVRGYVFNLLKGKIHIFWVFTISILIYAFDDFWYVGFSLSNIVFSIILGLSLTLSFYRTGSIWADTGIHYGLNVAYGLFFGLIGSPGTSIIIIKESKNETLFSNLLYYLIPALMFIFVLWAIKFYNKTTIPVKKIPFSA
jgi:membrane protease YdiL (CAAX protease family)